MPEDLLNFGLIPEFIGRLPVRVRRAPAASARTSSRSSTEPKNALIKQYQRFFGYDGIELVFTEDALWEIADKALERETGARGLRSIIESALLDVMFELPSRRDVTKCVITKESIAQGIRPTLVTSAGRPATSRTSPSRKLPEELRAPGRVTELRAPRGGRAPVRRLRSRRARRGERGACGKSPLRGR